MRKTTILFFVLAFVFMNGCNNSNDKNADNTKKDKPVLIPADSLMNGIMDNHDMSMAKMGKLSSMQNQVQQIIDSIERLPEKTKKMLIPYKTRLQHVLDDLKIAKDDMNQWMDEFNMDSAINNMEQRMKYLSEEKLKISKVKENIFFSLQKADSLIRQKF